MSEIFNGKQSIYSGFFVPVGTGTFLLLVGVNISINGFNNVYDILNFIMWFVLIFIKEILLK